MRADRRLVILGWDGRGLLSFTDKPTQVSERRRGDELHSMSPFPSKGRVEMSVFILKCLLMISHYALKVTGPCTLLTPWWKLLLGMATLAYTMNRSLRSYLLKDSENSNPVLLLHHKTWNFQQRKYSCWVEDVTKNQIKTIIDDNSKNPITTMLMYSWDREFLQHSNSNCWVIKEWLKKC